MEKIDQYLKLQKEIFIDDYRQYYWTVHQNGISYSPYAEELDDEDWNMYSYYENINIDQCIYRGLNYTIVLSLDTKNLRIFDNDKEIKE